MRFEYPTTRPYPWRFATISIITLSATVLVIISYFSVIAVGMTQASTTSTTFQEVRDPTLMERVSVHKALNFNPGCEPTTLVGGRTYQTTNGAFTYTLQSFTNRSNSQTLLSISYGSLPLDNCFVQSIGTFANFSADEASFVATVNCTLIGNIEVIATVLSMVALRMDNSLSVGMRWRSVALHRNGTQSTSFATAKLLAAFGEDLINQSLGSPDGKSMPKLYWDYSPQENMTRLESGSASRLPVGTVSITSDMDLVVLPPETVTVFRNFASVFWSAILLDLGVTSELNILTNSERFRSVIQNVSIPVSFHYDQMTGGTGVNAALSNTTAFGLPFVNAQSTSFSARYQCHNMKWKSPGRLVSNVLVTTLSFFVTYWGVLNLGLKYIVGRSSPDGGHCVCSNCGGQQGRRRPPSHEGTNVDGSETPTGSSDHGRCYVSIYRLA